MKFGLRDLERLDHRLARNVGKYQSVLQYILEERSFEMCTVLKSSDSTLNVHIQNQIMQQGYSFRD
jgi:hypothetical protein